jgi:hypothetical protein
VRKFTEFFFRLKNWSRVRRVIGKAEVLSAGDNPRFIVSNLPVEGFKRYTNRALFSSTPLNEAFFCPRGEMTNRRAAGAQFRSRHAQHAFSGEQPTASVAGELRVSPDGLAERLGLSRERTGAGDRGHPCA